MKKVIWAILIILIIAAIGVGGWFLWDSLQKEKNKTAELENRLEKVESLKDFNEENGNDSTNNTSSKNNEISSDNDEVSGDQIRKNTSFLYQIMQLQNVCQMKIG